MSEISAILHVCIGCVLIAISLIAQEDTFVPAADVSFTVSTDRNRYGSSRARKN